MSLRPFDRFLGFLFVAACLTVHPHLAAEPMRLPGPFPDRMPTSATSFPLERSVPTWEQVYLNFRSSTVWSDGKDIVVAGNYAYVTTYHGLAIFDITNPAMPVLISTVYLQEGYADDVTLSGNYAYVAEYGPGDYSGTWSSAMYIVNIANPASPFVAGRWSAPSSVHGVSVKNDIAYVAYGLVSGERGLAALDVSNPAQITVLGKLLFATNQNPPHRVLVSGDAAFLAGTNGLMVADITRPDSMTIIAENIDFSPWYWPYDLEISEDSSTLYVAYRDRFFPEANSAASIMDISNPANPTEISHIDFSARALDIDVEGNLMFVCNSTCGLRVVDISDPEEPELVGTYRTPGVAVKAAVQNGFVYLVDGGLLTTGDAEGGSCQTVTNPNGPSYGDFIVVDATTPALPTTEGFYSFPGRVTDVVVRNNLLLALNSNSGDSTTPGADMTVLDITNRTNPVVLGSYAEPGSGEAAVFVSDTIVLLAAGSRGMDVISLSDPQNPQQIINYPVVGNVLDVKTTGNYAFLATENGRIYIVDISQLNSPQPVTMINMLWPVFSLDIQWPHLFAAALAPTTNGRLSIFDMTNPQMPDEIYYLDGSVYNKVEVDGNRLYATWGQGFSIFDITDPTDPENIAGYGGAPATHGLAVKGNHVFVTNGLEGIQVFDVSDINSWQNAGSYNTPGFPEQPVIDSPYIYIPDTYGLLILEFDVTTDVPDPANPELPKNFALNQNYPNPFNAGTVISFELKERSHCNVTVYDLLGRRVKTLVNESLSANTHTVKWDGTNMDNQPVASGIYFYRMEVGGAHVSKKMTLVR